MGYEKRIRFAGKEGLLERTKETLGQHQWARSPDNGGRVGEKAPLGTLQQD